MAIKEIGKCEEIHVRDSELEFKVMARRNRLLGIWAPEKLGYGDDTAQAYAEEVMPSDFEEPGDEDGVTKVLGDFQKNGVATSETERCAEMGRLLGMASGELDPR